LVVCLLGLNLRDKETRIYIPLGQERDHPASFVSLGNRETTRVGRVLVPDRVVGHAPPQEFEGFAGKHIWRSRRNDNSRRAAFPDPPQAMPQPAESFVRRLRLGVVARLRNLALPKIAENLRIAPEESADCNILMSSKEPTLPMVLVEHLLLNSAKELVGHACTHGIPLVAMNGSDPSAPSALTQRQPSPRGARDENNPLGTFYRHLEPASGRLTA
jgi:hypothetical protein